MRSNCIPWHFCIPSDSTCHRLSYVGPRLIDCLLGESSFRSHLELKFLASSAPCPMPRSKCLGRTPLQRRCCFGSKLPLSRQQMPASQWSRARGFMGGFGLKLSASFCHDLPMVKVFMCTGTVYTYIIIYAHWCATHTHRHTGII